jgi:hypothetical protein
MMDRVAQSMKPYKYLTGGFKEFFSCTSNAQGNMHPVKIIKISTTEHLYGSPVLEKYTYCIIYV